MMGVTMARRHDLDKRVGQIDRKGYEFACAHGRVLYSVGDPDQERERLAKLHKEKKKAWTKRRDTAEQEARQFEERLPKPPPNQDYTDLGHVTAEAAGALRQRYTCSCR